MALCALALLMLGVVMVNSAGMGVANITAATDTAPELSVWALLRDSTSVYAVLAMLAMGVAAFVPLRPVAARLCPEGGAESSADLARIWTGLALAGGALVLVLLLVYAPIIGVERNGSHRWIALPIGRGAATSNSPTGPLTMQPSEIAKWAMIGLIAWYCAARGAGMRNFWTGLLPALVCLGLIAGVVVLEDLGTGLLIASAATVVLLAGGARLWHFVMFVPLGVIGVIGAIVTNPYRLDRITAFLNPYRDPEGTGYHMIQSMIAVANGAGFGRGLGHGLQKFGYLPEDQTDFVFAILCEEMGIAGAAVVVVLFVGVLLAGLGIIQRERQPVLRLLGLGILSTFGVQAVINMMVVTGLGPTKGIALPLVSSGGTGWILTAFCLGLLVNMDRTQAADESLTEIPGAEAATA